MTTLNPRRPPEIGQRKANRDKRSDQQAWRAWGEKRRALRESSRGRSRQEGGPTRAFLYVMMAPGEMLRCPEAAMGGRGFWRDDP